MLLRCRTRHAERISSKCSHVFAKLLHWRVLVKKDELWQPPETHPQCKSQNKLLKRSRASILLTQSHRRLCQSQCQPYSCLKWRSMSLLHSEKCLDSVNQDHSACVRNIWYDFGSLAGNSDLFVQVIAHTAAAAVPSQVLKYLKAGQITTLAKPTGGHRPLLMMSFLRRPALKSVMAAKKESVAKCAGPFAVRCWKTRWSKHNDQNHPIPCGS